MCDYAALNAALHNNRKKKKRVRVIVTVTIRVIVAVRVSKELGSGFDLGISLGLDNR